MTIRSKLLLLLLVIALLPLLAIAVFDLVTARQVAQKLARERRAILIADTQELLRTIVNSYGRVLQRDRVIIEHALDIQARQALSLLAHPDPPTRQVFYEADYRSPDTWPPDTVASTTHWRADGDGRLQPIPVSYAEQVVYLAPGVERDDPQVHDVVRRLSTMPKTYHELYLTDPEMHYWQYTATPEGIHTSYPGHAGYPEDYDPRTRPWYQEAKAAGKTVWKIMPEVSTRTISLTVAKPIYHADGRFAGVTAIDIPMTGLFDKLELPARWADDAEAMLVGEADDTLDHAGPAAVILAQQSYNASDQSMDWRKPTKLELLTSDPPAHIAQMMAAAAAGEPGVVRITIDGQPCLVAHGTGVVFPIIKLPESVFLEKIEAARQHVLGHMRARQAAELVAVGVVVALIVVVAVRASRRVTDPARQLADAADRLAQGDFEARVEVKGDDELAQLGRVFNQVGPHLAERQRIKHALSVAMDVQQNLLPKDTPTRDGLDVAGHSIYCDETGGDYYDYLDIIDLGPRCLAVVVGDVMGHGVAAAMLMATARGILRSRCRAPGSLADLLDHLNALLTQDTGGQRFMTMLIMVIDAQTRSLRWASAGHDMPLVVASETGEAAALDGSGLPLGIVADEVYAEYTHAGLSPGSVIFAATDGVWEARSPGQEQFGKQRVVDLLKRMSGQPAEAISRAVLGAVAAHRGDAAQDDDVTFVVTRVL